MAQSQILNRLYHGKLLYYGGGSKGGTRACNSDYGVFWNILQWLRCDWWEHITVTFGAPSPRSSLFEIDIIYTSLWRKKNWIPGIGWSTVVGRGNPQKCISKFLLVLSKHVIVLIQRKPRWINSTVTWRCSWFINRCEVNITVTLVLPPPALHFLKVT